MAGIQWMMLHAVQSMQSQTLTTISIALSFLGNYASYMWLIAFTIWIRGEKEGLQVGVLLLFTMTFTDLLKILVHTSRPIGLPGIVSHYTQSAAGASFPSGHAMAATVFWGCAARFARSPWRMLLLVIPVTIGLSRLYLGVHWPIDVIAGWVLGSAIVLLRFSLPSLFAIILLMITTVTLVPDTVEFGRFVATVWLMSDVCTRLPRSLCPPRWLLRSSGWGLRARLTRKMLVGSGGLCVIAYVLGTVAKADLTVPFVTGIWVQLVATML